MAFKFVLTVCAALLAVANAGFVSPVTYAAAHYSKSVQTPYSSVHKVDTRINNNVYTPAVAKTVSYAAPAYQTYAAPAVAKTVSYSAPAVQTYAAPAVHTYAAPAVQTYAAPAVHTYAAPAVQTYAAPVVKQAITYSPAATVAHVSFDGFGAHWGY
ncbi:pupal cuticle protein G1A-like [Stomoxys calcitrans]|uniref:pupal cuticle protein G1A-like n=1 Tax=Stomoxys calcitrans TaxID=35570 RepID=UPI0027E2A127|nr:pupal cuticle protein G1A-like [Stomoxys calcitrans]